MYTYEDDYVKDKLLEAQSKFEIFKDESVIKAFQLAAKAHDGQMRVNGDPYFQHCVETASLLATVCPNEMVIVAVGLMHDTLDDTTFSFDSIIQTLGEETATLVKEVSKLSQLSKLARESEIATGSVEADRMHTMILAMADIRAVLIKLADRLHNMTTLDVLPPCKQNLFANETMAVFAPLANRLGIVKWKEKLENICFKYLNTEKYNDLSSQVIKSFNEERLTFDVQKLKQALEDESLSYYDLTYRQKSLYSIHCKMMDFGEINDIHGIRLIVENDENCCKAIQIVHKLWTEVPGKFKDYITYPKSNGYQSLHTVVTRKGSVPLEVQIRTKDMHSQADSGFAAHWKYKEGNSMHALFVSRLVEWARCVLVRLFEVMVKPPSEFPFRFEDCPHSSYGSHGFVFVVLIVNKQMVVQEFPANATVKDLVTDQAGQASFRQE